MSELPTYEPDDTDNEHPTVAQELRNDISIRQRSTGIVMYAVYDGDEQISCEFGPIDDDACVAFAAGAAAVKDS